jgi:anti-sigma factor RsiW
MTPLVGCETARELLEPFLDGELTTQDQVMVQAHLRVCSTCALHVQDMALIGWSVRAGTPETCPAAEDAQALSVVQAGVLERIRAERNQSLPVRVREMFTDMRLLWPALGATTAVLACLYGSVTVWWLTTQKAPDSISAMIDTVAFNGTNTYPMRVENDVSMPVFLEDSVGFGPMSLDESMMAVDAVVTTEGRVAEALLLDAHSTLGKLHASDRQALMNAVRELRFAPAQQRGGRRVAVRTLLLIAHTTITEPWRPIEVAPPVQAVRRRSTVTPPVETAPAPPASEPVPGGGVGTLLESGSATV